MDRDQSKKSAGDRGRRQREICMSPMPIAPPTSCLGSWAVAADHGPGSKELHIVRALPGTIAAYRKDGQFPDGTVLVKEVFETATGEMTTGTVSHPGKTPRAGLSLMRDSSGRYAGNKLWGDGGAGRGSVVTARQRQRRPITRRIVRGVMCRLGLPIGFMSKVIRR